MESGRPYDAVIVGGGLAGTTVAAELALHAPPDFRTLLVDAAAPGPGTAYSPASNRLYMNGPADSMSAVPGDKRHLVRWLRTESEHALIPRSLFGRYLSERFYDAISGRSEFQVARAEIADLEATDNGFTLVDDVGTAYAARNVVLALGNFPPDDAFLPETLRRHSGYVADPWRFDPRVTSGSVLIVGSGLTAMDALALLDEHGFDGTVHLVSRHGLTPCVEHPACQPLDPKKLSLRTETPYALLRSLRAAARRVSAAGGDWIGAVEAIRTMSPSVWAAWSLRERRRFLRHLQAFWAIHRYRVPPQTAAIFERMESEGRIVRHRGRIAHAERLGDGRLRVDIAGREGTVESACVDTTINCTGPNGNYHRVRHPFVRNLVRRGFVRPDPLHLGLEATPDLQVVDGRGHPNERVYALGPPLRGLWYETTAVPETREQAARIARSLARDFVSNRLETAS